jgi:formyl-CoA transferase
VNRSVHRDWLNAEIEQRLARNTSDYWIATLNEAGVACGRINNVKEVFEEPQVRHLGMLKKVTSRHLGEQTLMGQPLTLSRTPSTIARAAPKRGEHTAEILAEIGYDGEAIARMKAAGVY